MGRIALAGAHGSGKTTLARLLANILIGHDLICSSARSVATRLGYATPRDVPDTDAALYQWLALMGQVKNEADSMHFVTDRSRLDYAAYGKLRGIEGAETYTRAAYHASEAYSLILYLPPNPTPEDDGVRFTHDVAEYDRHLRRMLDRWPGRVYAIKSDGPLNRAEEAIAEIERRAIGRTQPRAAWPSPLHTTETHLAATGCSNPRCAR